LQATVTTPVALREATVTRNFYLLRELIKRDFAARFTGSALGLFWAVLQPATLIAVYWFVFTFMIPVRSSDGGNDYMFFLIAGLIPWFAINEGMSRSMTCIVENGPMVRRLSLSSELLVVVPNVSSVFFEIVAFVLFLLAITVTRGWPAGAWLLVFALPLQFAIQIGLALVLAATYVFFRDLSQLLGFVLSVVFYLSPILYPASGRFERLFAWNPLTPLFGLFRSAVVGDPLPPPASIVLLLVVAIGILVAGVAFFRSVKRTLVDLV
jgi:ABC-type polysaccharide/polyol phosphate export permease